MSATQFTHVLDLSDAVDASDELKISAEFSELPVVDSAAPEAPTQTPTMKSTLFKRPESSDKLRGYFTLGFKSITLLIFVFFQPCFG